VDKNAVMFFSDKYAVTYFFLIILLETYLVLVTYFLSTSGVSVVGQSVSLNCFNIESWQYVYMFLIVNMFC